MTEDDVEILAREVGYDGYLRVERVRLRHKLFAGGQSQAVTRELIERGHAVGVLPYDPVRDEVVLIRQFRIGALAAGRDPWLVETVAGIIETGETAEDVARRETLEESGCTVRELIPVCDYLSSPGVMSETLTLFCGITDASAAGGIHGLDHEDEDIEAFVQPWETFWADVTTGKHADAKLLLAAMWLARNRETLRLRPIR